ncbi:MAG TPA: PH domain-containing protein [Longimicrobiaceae bacterium]
MLEGARGWLLRTLRVPAEPRAPGGGRVVRVFRAAPRYFQYRLATWALTQVGALAGLVGGFFFASSVVREIDHPMAFLVFTVMEGLAWAGFAAQLLFSLAVLRLDFDLRWYILSDRSLRIREGILSVREKTVTFANIQNISIRQNPLQRLLRIADVQVRTAGGGSGGHGSKGEVTESMHEAFFRGVENAEEIRDLIRERVRLHRDAGLGDPDEPPPLAEAGAGEPAVLAAARELRDEVRGMRRSLALPRGATGA